MRASSSTSFGAARALTSGANQISHNRLGPRPSPFNVDATRPSPSARLKSRTQPFINSVDSVDSESSALPLGLHSSTSDSKIWGKRRRRGAEKTTGAYGRVFTLVFFACLVLFLHALSGAGSGSGVPPVGDLYADPNPPSERIHTLRITRAPSTKNAPKAAGHGHGHDHLAVDPDGHYGSTSAPRIESEIKIESESGHPWGWGKRARVTPGAGDGAVPDSGEEVEGVPEPTVDETPACQSDSPHTPPPVSPPADARGVSTVTPRTALRDALSINPEETEMEMEMDLPLFELGDPAYALRVHLPASASLPEEHRRGKRARARGAMLL